MRYNTNDYQQNFQRGYKHRTMDPNEETDDDVWVCNALYLSIV